MGMVFEVFYSLSGEHSCSFVEHDTTDFVHTLTSHILRPRSSDIVTFAVSSSADFNQQDPRYLPTLHQRSLHHRTAYAHAHRT